MPPARSAAPGARAIQAPDSAGVVPAVLACTPHEYRGGCGLAGKVEAASTPRLVLSGGKGRRKGRPPRPAIRAGPPRCTPGIVPGGINPFSSRRRLASPRRPPRWAVGRLPVSIGPPGILPNAGAGIVPARPWSRHGRSRAVWPAHSCFIMITNQPSHISIQNDRHTVFSGFSVVFPHHAGFSACTATVYFGTMAVSPAGSSGRKRMAAEVVVHPRGRVRKLSWSLRTCPL